MEAGKSQFGTKDKSGGEVAMKRRQGRRFSLMTFVICDRKIIDTLKFRTKQGFTLLELLLVIGIILALISLIIGIVHISLNITRKIQCANNLRQIYLATKIYEEEFGAPPWFLKHFVTWKPEYASLLICPSDPYQGNLFKDSYDLKAFVPHSYFSIIGVIIILFVFLVKIFMDLKNLQRRY